MHAAFLAVGIVSQQRAKTCSEFRRARNAEPVPLRRLHPGASSSAASATRTAQVREHDSSAKSKDQHLEQLLQACGLAHMAPRFQTEHVGIDDLATASPLWLKTYFPEIQSGPAKRLLDGAIIWCGVGTSMSTDSRRTGSIAGRDAAEMDGTTTGCRAGADKPAADTRAETLADTQAMQPNRGAEVSASSSCEPLTVVPRDVASGSATGIISQMEQQRTWLLNTLTGVAHPSADGVTPSHALSTFHSVLFKCGIVDLFVGVCLQLFSQNPEQQLLVV